MERSDTMPVDSKLINVSMNATELNATGMKWRLTLSALGKENYQLQLPGYHDRAT